MLNGHLLPFRFSVVFTPAQVKTRIDPEKGFAVPHTPQGRFLHLPPDEPLSSWRNDFGVPWWKNNDLCIGVLTKKSRMVRVINTLTSQEHVVEVCSEETLQEILERCVAVL